MFFKFLSSGSFRIINLIKTKGKKNVAIIIKVIRRSWWPISRASDFDSRPRGYKTFFKLSSAERVKIAHK